jgi:hypothetical protein
MELLNLAAIATMGILVVVLAVSLTVAIGRNLKAGAAVREQLARRVAELPLGKMLKLVGVDSSRYLHGEYLKDVRQQIDTCESCDHNQHCSDTLEPSKAKLEDYGFCPNQESLQKVRAEIEAAVGGEREGDTQVSATRS